jgi:hypothetical protein
VRLATTRSRATATHGATQRRAKRAATASSTSRKPSRRTGRPADHRRRQAAGRHLRHESASLLYLRNQSLSFSELGTLDSRSAGANDACRASCVDWYGNSRPLFVRKRVFALMGYEIVEGRVTDNRIAEVRRVNYAPQSADYAMISK